MRLEKLTPLDERDIRRWPRYEGEQSVFNYALGESGWLADFPERPTNHRFSAWDEKVLVGFSILTETAKGEAEFYVAVRADLIGKGYGRKISASTLQAGFENLQLQRIHLKVRKWYSSAIRLYESMGFKTIGEKEMTVNHSPDIFVLMEVFARKWKSSN